MFKADNTQAVYLVVDCMNAPGRVLAVFDYLSDANEWCPDHASVQERTLLCDIPNAGEEFIP